ncbi:hypothetical protein B0H14DRAFT_2575470 [Mycena olivaceomarginata]|nr:hypothetical protein B0H14DRAFT_2575470 [Mycena olivaceomarginata]
MSTSGWPREQALARTSHFAKAGISIPYPPVTVNEGVAVGPIDCCRIRRRWHIGGAPISVRALDNGKKGKRATTTRALKKERIDGQQEKESVQSLGLIVEDRSPLNLPPVLTLPNGAFKINREFAQQPYEPSDGFCANTYKPPASIQVVPYRDDIKPMPKFRLREPLAQVLEDGQEEEISSRSTCTPRARPLPPHKRKEAAPTLIGATTINIPHSLSIGGGFVNTIACAPVGANLAASAAGSSSCFLLHRQRGITGQMRLSQTSFSHFADPCTRARTPLPVLEIHGGIDTDVPYSGGAGEGGTEPAIPDCWWAARNGCTAVNTNKPSHLDSEGAASEGRFARAGKAKKNGVALYSGGLDNVCLVVWFMPMGKEDSLGRKTKEA